ncbi:putative ribonuclease H-like domain-containing protein [Tanacetum coccineum]|uniref:Ribonuclease H-like domain-containing protein n=1 Tax=Tanacetum coccineum TaxID=301880 RepID=A0ABQ5E796_9ASTR
MAREAEFKKQRVFNTGNRVAKPVWTNANRVNHANHFVPRSVQLNAGRPNINSVRPRVNTGNSNVNTVRSRQPGNWGNVVKTSTCYNWRNSRPNFNCDSGPTFIRTVNAKGPQGRPKPNMEDRGIFDNGCSRHMTGNKDHLDDFEECKGGSVTFGGSKGYITGKGRIRVDALMKNQKLLKVHRQNNMYSFDMKTPGLTKDYACLIAKATSYESKLWHRRSDNGTEFKNRNMLEFCGNKRIKQEYSNAQTPQQNGVAERMNKTLIKEARTMLADSLLPTTFWAEAVNTACYIFVGI